jgi:hypothetical protein
VYFLNPWRVPKFSDVCGIWVKRNVEEMEVMAPVFIFDHDLPLETFWNRLPSPTFYNFAEVLARIGFFPHALAAFLQGGNFAQAQFHEQLFKS